MNIDPSTLPDKVCACGNIFFDEKLGFKTLSAIHPANDTAEEQQLAYKALLCTECKKVLQFPLPGGSAESPSIQ